MQCYAMQCYAMQCYAVRYAVAHWRKQCNLSPMGAGGRSGGFSTSSCGLSARRSTGRRCASSSSSSSSSLEPPCLLLKRASSSSLRRCTACANERRGARLGRGGAECARRWSHWLELRARARLLAVWSRVPAASRGSRPGSSRPAQAGRAAPACVRDMHMRTMPRRDTAWCSSRVRRRRPCAARVKPCGNAAHATRTSAPANSCITSLRVR